jgi:hypothetical protein
MHRYRSTGRSIARHPISPHRLGYRRAPSSEPEESSDPRLQSMYHHRASRRQNIRPPARTRRTRAPRRPACPGIAPPRGPPRERGPIVSRLVTPGGGAARIINRRRLYNRRHKRRGWSGTARCGGFNGGSFHPRASSGVGGTPRRDSAPIRMKLFKLRRRVQRSLGTPHRPRG